MSPQLRHLWTRPVTPRRPHGPFRNALEQLEDRSVPATFTEAGSLLTLDLNTTSEAVGIVSSGATYTLTLNGANTWVGTNSANVTGNGTGTLTVTAAGVAAFTTQIALTDSAAGTSVTFNDSAANAYANTFDVTLDNAPGTVAFNGASNFGANNLFVTTARDIQVNTGASVTSTSGNIFLSANQQVTPTSGNFVGVDINGGTVQATGAGAVTVNGQGGDDVGGFQHGVQVRNGGLIRGGAGGTTVNGTGGASSGNGNFGVYVTDGGSAVTSSGGAVQVTGQGGGVGSGNSIGVYVRNGAQVTSAGTGSGATVTVQGTGGASSGGSNYGVYVSGSAVTSSGGAVQVTGQGGGSGAAGGNYGVVVNTSGQVTSGGSGAVSVTGTGGSGAGSTNYGVYVLGTNATITSGGGSVSVTATGNTNTNPAEAIRLESSGSISSGGNAAITVTSDSVSIDTSATPGTISAGTGTVTIVPRTAGTMIDLGGADVLTGSPLTLGLTSAELNQITAGTLVVGDATDGAMTVSAAVTLPAATNVQLTTGGALAINPGSFNTAGGSLKLTAGSGGVQPTTGGTDLTASTVSFGSGTPVAINITNATTSTQLIVAGAIDLGTGATAATLSLSGSYALTAADVITLVSATSVSGRFSGYPDGFVFPFNGVLTRINYTATAVTLTPQPPQARTYLSPFAGDTSAALAGLSAQQRMVQTLYLTQLGRAGSAAELNGWVGFLNGGGSQAAVSSLIAASPEARTNLVRGWYRTYLGRDAGPGEEQGYVAALTAGLSEEAALANILGSPEFFTRAQTLVSSGAPNERFAQALYLVLLNRTPSAAEVAQHAAYLNGGLSRTQLAAAFLSSPEFRTDLVTEYYQTLLHRSPSATEVAGWVNSGLDFLRLRLAIGGSSEVGTTG